MTNNIKRIEYVFKLPSKYIYFCEMISRCKDPEMVAGLRSWHAKRLTSKRGRWWVYDGTDMVLGKDPLMLKSEQLKEKQEIEFLALYAFLPR